MKKDTQKLWNDFGQRLQLTEAQLASFQKYYSLIIKSNEDFNLTAITSLDAFLAYHFEDSLALRNFVDVQSYDGFADIGTGAGFPAIPLKIMYPDMPCLMIEVTKKKIEFLEHVCDELSLDNIEIYPLDWRTFLRKTDYSVNLFCSRASLQPEELIRIFSPICPYKSSDLFYWAAEDWQPSEKVNPYIANDYIYKIRNKTRKLVMMQDKK